MCCIRNGIIDFIKGWVVYKNIKIIDFIKGWVVYKNIKIVFTKGQYEFCNPE